MPQDVTPKTMRPVLKPKLVDGVFALWLRVLRKTDFTRPAIEALEELTASKA
jgi:hypothetical protein